MNRVENIVSKRKIARFEQFLLLSQGFQKSSAAEASDNNCMWERINNKKDLINKRINNKKDLINKRINNKKDLINKRINN